MRFVAGQCKQCPFRPASWARWLGDYTVADLFRAIWHGEPFFCHMAINYRAKNWLDRAMRVGKLCTGGLVAANNAQAPDSPHPQIVEARRLVREVPRVDCMTWKQFMEHHEVKP